MSHHPLRSGAFDIVPHTLLLAISDIIQELLAEQRRKEAGGGAAAPKRDTAKGEALRPGARTPLWNALVESLKPLLTKRGAQARLARHLGLQRQAVNAFVTQRSRMPDAERTLQILAWIAATKRAQSTEE